MKTTTETADHTVKLRELPVTVNVTQMAEGIFGLFTEDERVVLRFGMLPAKKMEVLQQQLREKFDGLGKHPREAFPLSVIADMDYDEDTRFSTVNGEFREWNLRKLVSEATHEITLGIYAIGDLIV